MCVTNAHSTRFGPLVTRFGPPATNHMAEFGQDKSFNERAPSTRSTAHCSAIIATGHESRAIAKRRFLPGRLPSWFLPPYVCERLPGWFLFLTETFKVAQGRDPLKGFKVADGGNPLNAAPGRDPVAGNSKVARFLRLYHYLKKKLMVNIRTILAIMTRS